MVTTPEVSTTGATTTSFTVSLAFFGLRAVTFLAGFLTAAFLVAVVAFLVGFLAGFLAAFLAFFTGISFSSKRLDCCGNKIIIHHYLAKLLVGQVATIDLLPSENRSSNIGRFGIHVMIVLIYLHYRA